jgi:RHS repeat-associated protein
MEQDGRAPSGQSETDAASAATGSWASPGSDAGAAGSGASAADGAEAAPGKGSLPVLNLPKGGGAIRGIGEKFAANPVTGTGTMTIPVHASPGRSGFGPELELTYNSGTGNGSFGFGWSMSLPSVTRKTDKGLPQYQDDQESDIFILSGAEDLMPALVYAAGQWTRDVTPSRPLYGNQYAVHRYRPRVDSLFARIERWVNLEDPQDTFWRSITRDNITSWYGKTAASRIADPADAARVFSWLICESYDDKGNIVSYEYKPEDSEGVDLSQVNERNRTHAMRSANRYIKRIFYGNRVPYFPDLTVATAVPLPTDWCFELVFDYGDHDPLNPVPQDTGIMWACRLDPFSIYRPTFEVRTYRLCRRVLMFHNFPEDPNSGADYLVRSTDLTHPAAAPPDPSQPFYSYLLSTTQSGYRRDGAGGYLSDSLPPIEFEYTQATVDETVRDVTSASLRNLPYGLDGMNYRWVDLDGEGLSGILTEQAGSWFYKANLSPVNQQLISGNWNTLPLFAPVELVARQPSTAALGQGRQQLFSVSGDGQLDLVQFQGPVPGYYERTDDESWQPFVAFESVPVVDWRDPELRFIDLTGDGFPDLLISEGDAFSWYRSLSTQGFASGQRIPQAFDEETGPRLVFSDGTESIFLADLSGDGLTDLVRIRNGEVCYWPNQGYGRFGTKITMDSAPLFDHPDLFDGRRIQLADIDGSGTADIVYFGSNAVQLYFNQSGNGWGAVRVLGHFPPVNSVSRAAAIDLLGNGTACLVWSSPLPGNVGSQMRYIDLMGGQKPHLLVSETNNLGATSVIHYAPSTKFYVADKLAGDPWVTRLPFPVQVVERVETYDYVSRNLFVTRYAYHHGYYDGVEREFRGFGRVDQWDTEEFATLTSSPDIPEPVNLDAASAVPPVLTKTWFHSGAYFGEAAVSTYMQTEYYAEGDPSSDVSGLSGTQFSSLLLNDTVLPSDVLLPDGTRLGYAFSPEECREACRALRGSLLRQEVYAIDGTPAADRPYSVSERNHTIEAFQPRGPNQYGVFFSHSRETVDFRYERQLYPVADGTITEPGAAALDAADPRVGHVLTLSVDQYGNVLQSASVGYGRRYRDPALSPADQATQATTLSTYLMNEYTNAVESDDVHRTPRAAQSSTYELIQVQPAAAVPDVTNLFGFAELTGILAGLADGLHDILYEDLDPSGLTAGQAYRRLIGQSRTYYRPDDLGAAAGDPRALLPLGTLASLALPGAAYKLAFTPGLITQVYQRGGTALLPDPAGVLGSTAADGGGYVDLAGNGYWWIAGGRTYYLPTSPVSPLELDQARQHFFLPRRLEDPFSNPSSVSYDSDNLLVVQTADAVNNTISAVNDYRVLAPGLITDANGNQASASFNVLGLVTATAVMGKPGQNLGDTLTGFSADLAQAQIDALYDAADPHTLAPSLLGDATTRVIYDLHGFYNSKAAAPADPTTWRPPFAATVARETHVSALSAGQQSVLQIGFSYSDGFGREIQKKSQAEPGPVVDNGPVVDPRWVGSGWTIFNNKGKPVRQYEPFFSRLPAAGHQFEFGMQVGVSPILCYDPPGRVVATIYPDHTYQKVVFDPWHLEAWDAGDTVLQADPATDSDVGDFFQRLPPGDYSPTWYSQYTGGSLLEQAAAAKAAAYTNTPAVSYCDPLGRTFLSVADNGTSGKYLSHIVLDIQGNQRSETDALNREVVVYDYAVLGVQIHQASMEADERWNLGDAAGKAIRSWDSRGHNFRTAYDALRRPLGLYVVGTDPVNSDPRTLPNEALYETIDYGEGQVNDQLLNLRTRIFRHYDSAGVVNNVTTDPATAQEMAYDFKGNLLGSSRQFVQDEQSLPDWTQAPPTFLPDVFVISTQYDALNRVTAASAPDGSVFRPTYNEANLLAALTANLSGAAATTSFVTNIDYNPKGQRVLIEYGNDVSTTYSYDPLTFRLTSLTTNRPGFPAAEQTVQALSYTYEPAANITHIQDDADLQNVVFFRNRRVEPSADFTYDAIYRLIQASGREQLGLNGGTPFPPAPTSYNDVPRVGLLSPSDGKAMGTYTEQYVYDSVGNFLELIHKGSDPANPGWSRSYTYNETSLLNPGEVSNRLSNTAASGSQPLIEPYSYDPHGNMTAMPQLQRMQWDFKDRLYMTSRQPVNASDGEGTLHQGERTYYVYNAAGERVRKTTVSASDGPLHECFYVGNYEVYRRYAAPGNVTLERHTLHAMDDKQRVALVETVTVNVKASSIALPTTTIRYQFGNHLGSACLELDETGAVLTYEEYYPYGSTSYQAGATTTEASRKRYRFTGKERDPETGLEYHSARYYAPWLGRWTACDPKGPEPGANLYAYVNGQPTRLTDPSGRDGWDRFWGGVKAVGGALEAWAGATMVAAGVATGWTGVGLLLAGAGAVVTAHGIDTLQAGVRTAVTGKPVDTYTSQLLQDAGLTRRQANLVDAAIGVIGTLGATAAARAPSVIAAARTGSEANALVHLTSAEGAAAIDASQTLGKGASTVYAGPASLADSSTAGRVLRTGVPPSSVTDVVSIPDAAAGAFRVPVVVGPFTAWQRAAGTVYSAGAGSLNLATDAFTRTGPALNQMVISGIDATINMAGRSAPTIQHWFDWGPNAKTGSIDPALKLQLSPTTTVKIGTIAPSGTDAGVQPDSGGVPFGHDERSSPPQAAGVGATVTW